MNTDEINNRKQKLNNIIKKITDSQLLKIREADSNNVRTLRQDCKFAMNPQERDNEMNKAMSTKLLNDKELCQYGANVGKKSDMGGPSSEIPSAHQKPL